MDGSVLTILGPPAQSEDPDDWSIRMEVLKCLNKFDQIFSSLTEIEYKVVVGPLWQTFVSSLRVYEPLSVGGADDPHEGRYDFDGAEEKKKSLESFIIQLFALLLTIVGGRRLAKVVANRFSESHGKRSSFTCI